MKKKLIGILSLLVLSTTCLLAQPIIKVEMPEFANRNLVVTLKKGLLSDTVFNAKLDDKGLASVRLPMSEANFSGIAVLAVGPQESIDIIINRKGFTFRNTGTDFSSANIQFVGSEENVQFLAWKEMRILYDQKFYLISQLASLYTAEDVFYQTLTKERERLETTRPGFKSPQPDWYAPRFAKLIDFLTGKLANLESSKGQIEAEIAVRNYAIESLDIEALYTSGFWFNVINGILEIYQPNATFHHSFGRDMSMILRRTASLPVYEAFAGDLMMICMQFGWDKAQDELVNFLLNEQRITNPTNPQLKAAFAMADIVPGKVAPSISGIEQFSDGTNKTLLFFYSSGCEHCQDAIKDLKAQYDFFVKNNVRIITVSADTEENIFEAYAADFPWADKVADFKGFSSGNFKTYGIMATPTMFLLDSSDKIINRFAHVNDVISYLKNEN